MHFRQKQIIKQFMDSWCIVIEVREWEDNPIVPGPSWISVSVAVCSLFGLAGAKPVSINCYEVAGKTRSITHVDA